MWPLLTLHTLKPMFITSKQSENHQEDFPEGFARRQKKKTRSPSTRQNLIQLVLAISVLVHPKVFSLFPLQLSFLFLPSSYSPILHPQLLKILLIGPNNSAHALPCTPHSAKQKLSGKQIGNPPYCLQRASQKMCFCSPHKKH